MHQYDTGLEPYIYKYRDPDIYQDSDGDLHGDQDRHSDLYHNDHRDAGAGLDNGFPDYYNERDKDGYPDIYNVSDPDFHGYTDSHAHGYNTDKHFHVYQVLYGDNASDRDRDSFIYKDSYFLADRYSNRDVY